jgi:hypothetical protein
MLQALREEYGLHLTPEGLQMCLTEIKTSGLGKDNSEPSTEVVVRNVLNRTLKGISAAISDTKTDQFHSNERVVEENYLGFGRMLSGLYLFQIVSSRNLSNPLISQDASGPGRMIGLVLTDGHSRKEAIEYQTIERLDLRKCLPGSKLTLKSPVLVNNVIFMVPKSFVSISGRIESLAIGYEEKFSSQSRTFLRTLAPGEAPPPAFLDFSNNSRNMKPVSKESDQLPVKIKSTDQPHDSGKKIRHGAEDPIPISSKTASSFPPQTSKSASALPSQNRMQDNHRTASGAKSSRSFHRHVPVQFEQNATDISVGDARLANTPSLIQARSPVALDTKTFMPIPAVSQGAHHISATTIQPRSISKLGPLHFDGVLPIPCDSFESIYSENPGWIGLFRVLLTSCALLPPQGSLIPIFSLRLQFSEQKSSAQLLCLASPSLFEALLGVSPSQFEHVDSKEATAVLATLKQVLINKPAFAQVQVSANNVVRSFVALQFGSELLQSRPSLAPAATNFPSSNQRPESKQLPFSANKERSTTSLVSDSAAAPPKSSSHVTIAVESKVSEPQHAQTAIRSCASESYNLNQLPTKQQPNSSQHRGRRKGKNEHTREDTKGKWVAV